MKVELTDKEMEYLQNKVFCDWKRAEIDTWSIGPLKLKGKIVKIIKAEEKWYRELYEKLGGELWRK